MNALLALAARFESEAAAAAAAPAPEAPVADAVYASRVSASVADNDLVWAGRD
jgi:hypothetical protein